MKKFKKLLEKRWFAYTFAACAAVLVFLFFSNIGQFFHGIGIFFKIISPFVGGLVFAYLLNPIMVFFEKKLFRGIKSYWPRHIAALLLVVACVLVVFFLLIMVLVPTIIDSIVSIISNLPTYQKNIIDFLEGIKGFLEAGGVDVGGAAEVAGSMSSLFLEFVRDNIGKVVSQSIWLGTSILNFLIGCIFILYFLAGKERLLKGLEKFRRAVLTEEQYESHTRFFARCHYIVIRFVGCDLLDALIIGTVNMIFMLIAGMPHVALISVIVAVANLVPTFGPIVGGIIGGILLLFTNPFHTLIFLLFSLALQTVDGYIIKPKLFGDVLGVPAVWVLVSIIIGGALFGVIGMLLSIPMAAIITFIYHDYFLPYMRIRKEKKQKVKEKDSSL